ncbi:hypothetical protein [Flavobacterium sp. 3HN19-14]|uniref:hypothetical protein n=1 Tax=Flavobacterium sp. 3HN19-14 TaxID=3448133 RepID=UPI003EDF805B
MKKALFFIATIFCISSIHAQDEKPEPIKLKGVIIENDFHENITWIKSKPIPLVRKDFTVNALEVTFIQIYFGLKVVDGKQTMTPIHIVNNYKSSDWIFFDEVSYLLGSGKEIRQGKGVTFKITDDDTNRDVNRGVSEFSDVIAGDSAIAFIKYVLENKTGLNVRYLNTHKNQYVDIEVPNGTEKLQKHFKALIDSYNLLNTAYALNKPF